MKSPQLSERSLLAVQWGDGDTSSGGTEASTRHTGGPAHANRGDLRGGKG